MTVLDPDVHRHIRVPAAADVPCGAIDVVDETASEVDGLQAQFGAARRGLREATMRYAAVVAGEGLAWAIDDEVAESLLELVAIKRQLETVAGDLAARVGGGSVWTAAGFRTMESWIRARTNESWSGARRAVEDGDWLGSMPVMGAAWRAGEVSRAHVQVLAEAHTRYPRLSEALSSIEADLAAIAKDADPAWFRRTLFAKLHELDPAAVDEADGRRRRRDVGLHVTTVLDGYVRVDGLLIPEIGQQLVSALASARDALRNTESDDRTSLIPAAEPRLSARNVEALGVVLGAAASASGGDRLPDVGGERPVVHISVESESLIADGPAAPGWISSLTGIPVTPVTAEGARRLSCDATAQLLVLDPRGNLDAISATWRTAPPGLRRYVLIREGGRCRFPGCRTAIREVHHIVHWAKGGPTTTSNLVGLCSHHHHLVHEGRWTIAGHPDHTLTFTDPHHRSWQSDPPARE